MRHQSLPPPPPPPPRRTQQQNKTEKRVGAKRAKKSKRHKWKTLADQYKHGVTGVTGVIGVGEGGLPEAEEEDASKWVNGMGIVGAITMAKRRRRVVASVGGWRRGRRWATSDTERESQTQKLIKSQCSYPFLCYSPRSSFFPLPSALFRVSAIPSRSPHPPSSPILFLPSLPSFPLPSPLSILLYPYSICSARESLANLPNCQSILQPMSDGSSGSSGPSGGWDPRWGFFRCFMRNFFFSELLRGFEVGGVPLFICWRQRRQRRSQNQSALRRRHTRWRP